MSEISNSKKAVGGNMLWTFYSYSLISILVNKNLFAMTEQMQKEFSSLVKTQVVNKSPRNQVQIS